MCSFIIMENTIMKICMVLFFISLYTHICPLAAVTWHPFNHNKTAGKSHTPASSFYVQLMLHIYFTEIRVVSILLNSQH